LALRVAEHERPYFDQHVQPLLHANVELLPELNAEQKYQYMSRARAVLFTSQWEEPFGLVMTEAMASGAPVIAFRRGAAPEIIVDGETGFLCDTEEDMVAALAKVDAISPVACRRHVEALFNRERIASRYLNAYRQALRQPAKRAERESKASAAD
jgi:glycosyltransferase involved in cell wall biosynthesis